MGCSHYSNEPPEWALMSPSVSDPLRSERGGANRQSSLFSVTLMGTGSYWPDNTDVSKTRNREHPLRFCLTCNSISPPLHSLILLHTWQIDVILFSKLQLITTLWKFFFFQELGLRSVLKPYVISLCVLPSLKLLQKNLNENNILSNKN